MVAEAKGSDNDAGGKRGRHPRAEDAPVDRRCFGDHLRRWRRVRQLSQLGLAVATGVSARHLSFLETGRSRPSREMVLRLANALAVPLRERNPMLESAGFAPMYRLRAWDDPDLRPAMRSVHTVLAAHMPHPALALDRLYDVVASNDAAEALLRRLLPHGEGAKINVIRATLHPRGLAPRIVNFPEWRADVLMRLRQQARLTGDAALSALHREVAAYPGPGLAPVPRHARPEARPDLFLPLELRVDRQILRFVTTMTVFGSPHDIALQELAIETFLAADEATACFLRDVCGASAARASTIGRS